MKSRMRLAAIVGVLPCFLLSAGPVTAGEIMYAVNSGLDALYTIDLDTGETTVIGPRGMGTSADAPVSLAGRANGALFADNDLPTVADGIFIIDPPSGLASFLDSDGGVVGSSPGPAQALAFSSTGILYTLSGNPPGAGGGQLAIVHQMTGEKTLVGGDSIPELQGFDFNPADGFLYGISGSSSGDATLLKISTSGSLVSSTPLSQNIGALPGALAFTSTGRLVGTTLTGELFDIDPASGQVGNVRSVAGGAAFSPQGLARALSAEETALVYEWRPFAEGTGGGGAGPFCCTWFDYWDQGWDATLNRSDEPGAGDIAILNASQFHIYDTDLNEQPLEAHIRYDAAVSELRIATQYDHLVIGYGRIFTVVDGPILNDGLIRAEGGTLSIEGAVNLSGSGELALNPSNSGFLAYYSQILGATTDSVLNHAAGHVIRGSGKIGGDSLGLINHGLIDANNPVDGTNLTIDPSDHDLDGLGADVINVGTLRASNGGTLRLSDGVFANQGVIEAWESSVVELASNAKIVGGTLQTMGDGVIRIKSSEAPILAGEITHHGNMETNGALVSRYLKIEDVVTLGGTGELVLTDFFHQIQGQTSDALLVHGADHSIRGKGQIGADSLGLINHGLIDADMAGFIPYLTIDPSDHDLDGLGADVVNVGTLRASNGGTLRLSDGVFANQGVIEAWDGSAVELASNAKIVGGTLQTMGDGVIRIMSGQMPILAGEITHHGNMETNGHNVHVYLKIEDVVTLGGTGELVLTHPFHSIRGQTPDALLVHGADHSIRGTSRDMQVDVVNYGAIEAEGAAGFTFNHSVTNHGEIYVPGESRVVFNGGFAGSQGTSGAGPVYVNGELRPGDVLGAIAFGGDLDFGPSSVLEIEIGGEAPGLFGAVAISGTALLDGTLNIALVDPSGGNNPFEPRAGHSFEILTAGGGLLGSTFDIEPAELPALNGELYWDVVYGNDFVRLDVISPYASDFDGDGTSDASDLAWWNANYGNAGAQAVTAGRDFLDWQREQTTARSSAASAAVPEPGTLALCLCGAILLGRLRSFTERSNVVQPAR